MQLAAGAEGDVLANDAVRADLAADSNVGMRMNDSRRMNHSGDLTHPSMSINATSASLTTSPLTEQTPRALPIFPRDLVNSTLMTKVSPGRTGFRHFTDSA